MTASGLEPIVLGHNAFFGVDHLSAGRGAERSAHFADPARIMEVVRAAVGTGAGAMMMSTHERAGPLCEAIANAPDLADRLAVYPLLPYAQKFVTRANEVGMINVVMDMISGTSIADKSRMIWTGGKAILARDVFSVLSTLIQVELKTFSKLRMPVVFLHDAFTDLALCLGLKDVFAFYIEEIDRLYSARGAFATKNLPMLLARFEQWGLPAPIVMAHFNAAGFHMNPDRDTCERAIEKYDVSVMAMGSLASGFLAPHVAYEYLGRFRNIKSVVVGVSRVQHLEETFGAIKEGLRFASRSMETARGTV